MSILEELIDNNMYTMFFAISPTSFSMISVYLFIHTCDFSGMN